MANACGNCFYFRPGHNTCQQGSPTLNVLPQNPYQAWPEVRVKGWCGVGADSVTGKSFSTGLVVVDPTLYVFGTPEGG